MTVLRVAAVQESYVLMDRDATIDRVAALTASAAREGAQLVVFPEVFVPDTPLWIDTQPIWDGDEEWFGLLARNAVVIGGPASDRLAAIAAEHGVWLVVGVDEREAHGATIYFVPDGELAGRHRKLMPTGAERTVWGTGDGSTLAVVDAGRPRIGGRSLPPAGHFPAVRRHLAPPRGDRAQSLRSP
jgi:nitrilase